MADRKRYGVTAAVIALVCVGGFIVVGGSYYTSSSSSCTNCHEMSTRYVSWTRSTHAKVDCMDCHSGVGLAGFISAKIGGARRLIKHLGGTIGDISVTVADEVCLKCHFISKDPNFQFGPETDDDPLISPSKLHTDHFDDAEALCNLCHMGLVHGSLAGGIPVNKESCEECHQRKKIYVEIKPDPA